MPHDRPVCLVFNARSGSRDARADRDAIVRLLRDAGRGHEVFEAEGDVASVAARAGAVARARGGVLAVAGGDGTLNAVAQVALQMSLPFGVVPRGTFNYFSRAHGIPLDTEAAVAALLAGEERPAQAGLVNGRIFLVNASVGLYPRILQDREAYKQRYGRNRYVALWAALTTLMREHRLLTLRYERDRAVTLVRTPTLFVGNNPLQLERIGVPEASDVEAGHLAAIILKPRGRLALLELLLRGAAGDVCDSANVVRFAFRQLTVHPRLPFLRRNITVATDGEVAMLGTPLVFSVAPRPLRLIVPRASTTPP